MGRIQQTIHDATIIGENDEAFGVGIKSAHWKDVCQMYFLTDAGALSGRLGTDATRFVVGIIDIRFLRTIGAKFDNIC
jgi:hypothetical protein